MSGEMSLFEHLAELRKRLLISIALVVVAALIVYGYTPELFEIIATPFRESFKNAPLIGTGPGEAFSLKLKLAIFGGIILSAPLLFQQFWLFVSPGLLEQERKLFLPFVLVSTLLFLSGVYFCYKAFLPIVYAFFASEYGSISIEPTIRVSEFISFVTLTVIAFGSMFEMPVLAFFLAKLGVLTSKAMLAGFRYAVVIIFVIAAVLTPPDVISQTLMAIPLLLLYGLSILVVRVVESGDKKRTLDSNA